MNVTCEQVQTLYQLIQEYTTRGKPLLYAYTAKQGLVEGCVIAIFGKQQLIIELSVRIDPNDFYVEHIIFEDGETIKDEQ